MPADVRFQDVTTKNTIVPADRVIVIDSQDASKLKQTPATAFVGPTGATGATGPAGANGTGTGDMLKSENLSGLANYTTARTNMGLGTLSTQSGIFSGTSSGTNTGDNATNTQYSGLATSKAELAGSTTQAFSVSQLEVGNATDTTLSRVSAGVITVEGVTLARYATTTEASNATPTPALGASTHTHTVTALAAGATFGAPTGTPFDGQSLIVRIKDNGTARTLAFNAIYRASTDLVLPTTTIISKTLYLGFKYNSADSKWDLIALLNNI